LLKLPVGAQLEVGKGFPGLRGKPPFRLRGQWRLRSFLRVSARFVRRDKGRKVSAKQEEENDFP